MGEILDIIQGTPEWFEARLGKPTASRMADVTAKLKNGKPGASRENYMAELLCERFTGKPYDSYQSPAMLRGTELEPQAREAYEFQANVTVTQVGLVLHPALPSAASPDGLVGDQGLVEFKCPNTATHLAMLEKGTIDGKYIKQMQWQMACAVRKWCDFVSFDDRLPLKMQLFIKRVERDDDMIATLVSECLAFCEEIDKREADLRNQWGL